MPAGFKPDDYVKLMITPDTPGWFTFLIKRQENSGVEFYVGEHPTKVAVIFAVDRGTQYTTQPTPEIRVSRLSS